MVESLDDVSVGKAYKISYVAPYENATVYLAKYDGEFLVTKILEGYAEDAEVNVGEYLYIPWELYPYILEEYGAIK